MRQILIKQIVGWLFLLLLSGCSLLVDRDGQIQNPVASKGHDPWVIQKDGFYYYSFSHQDSIYLNRHQKLQDVLQFEGQEIWSSSPNTPYSKHVWVPELHFLQGKWYVYFAADDGKNENHRMYVLEGKTDDPMGEYVFKGKISDPSDKWAIDGTVLEHAGELYFIWSGWEGEKNVQQNLYIAKMKDPESITGERVLISQPDYDWEKIGEPLVNEAPQVLKKDGLVFLIYSASGSWTNDYCLGQLTLTGDNPLDPASWVKSPTPVFRGTETVFSPGHASFVKSPNGQEDWIVYHTAKRKNAGWNRDVNMKPFTWDGDGNPIFGSPETKGTEIPAPSR